MSVNKQGAAKTRVRFRSLSGIGIGIGNGISDDLSAERATLMSESLKEHQSINVPPAVFFLCSVHKFIGNILGPPAPLCFSSILFSFFRFEAPERDFFLGWQLVCAN